MKMTTYSIVCNRSWCEGEDSCCVARYTSVEEAKKHLKALFNRYLNDKNYSDVAMRNDICFRCSYDLFKYDNVCSYEIIEEDIEIFDVFSEDNI